MRTAHNRLNQIRRFESFFTSFSTLYETNDGGNTLAIAVSGGPDSLALTLLLKDWSSRSGVKLVGLTVDHGLRAESRAEAEQVAAWMANLGIPHHILSGTVAKGGNLLEAARTLRYQLLLNWCKANGVEDLALAHHADDQRETFFHNLARGSGLKGLSGMASFSEMEEIRLWRPILSYLKSDLLIYLEDNKHTWIEDPTNRDPRYFRTQTRQKAPVFDKMGLTSPNVSLAMSHLREAEEDLGHLARSFITRHVTVHPWGHVAWPIKAYREALKSVKKRILYQALAFMNQSPQNLRTSTWQTVFGHLEQERREPVTAHGTLLFCHRQHCYLVREPAAGIASPVFGVGVWDRRWRYEVEAVDTEHPKTFSWKYLGESGWRQIARKVETSAAGKPLLKPDMPRRLLYSLPAVFHLDEVAAVPHLHYTRDKGNIALTCRLEPQISLGND